MNGSLLEADFSLCPRCFVAPRPPIDAMSDVAGAPLRYNQPEPRFASGLIIAADPVLHRDLVAALQR